MYSDSHNAIKLSNNEEMSRWNKHIDNTFCFVRDIVQRKKWGWIINQQMKWLLIYSLDHLDVLPLRHL